MNTSNFKLHFGLILLITIFALSCTKEEEEDCLISETLLVENAIPVDNCVEEITSPCGTNKSKSNISIRNFSRYDICDLEYNGAKQNRRYGNIISGGCTCYISHEEAYYYPLSMRYFDYSGEVTRGAIDFVGVGLLESGERYNYNLWSIRTNKRHYRSGYMIKSEEDFDYLDAISSQCGEDKDINCGIDTNKVNIRIVNESIFSLCTFSYENSNNELIDFGNIPSGQTTCYIPLEMIDEKNYRIAFSINGSEHASGLTWEVSPVIVHKGNYSLYVTIRTLNGEGIQTILEED